MLKILHAKIEQGIQKISKISEGIKRVRQSMVKRFQVCIQMKPNHFEQLL